MKECDSLLSEKRVKKLNDEFEKSFKELEDKLSSAINLNKKLKDEIDKIKIEITQNKEYGNRIAADFLKNYSKALERIKYKKKIAENMKQKKQHELERMNKAKNKLTDYINKLIEDIRKIVD